MNRRASLTIAGVLIAACSGAASAQFATMPAQGSGIAARSVGDYVLDDGAGETNLGWSQTDPGALTGLNEFTVEADKNIINEIHIAPGTNPAGSIEITLLIFANPTGNPAIIGPSDLLFEEVVTLEGAGSDDFQTFPVPDIDVGDVGDSFLVGFYVFAGPDQFNHRIDTTSPQGQSWVSGGAMEYDPADPNSAPGIALTNLSGFAFNGNFMIRASADGGSTCIADWNGDGEVDIQDFFGYLSDFEAGDPRADLNNDGEIDIQDFFIFLQEFEEGC